MAKLLYCWNCGESLENIPLPISRHANCESCFEVLHCCRMCRHYKTDRRPECDHERADPPLIKENANFCDYFKPANQFDPKKLKKAGKAKSNLDSLFDRPGDLEGLSDGVNEKPEDEAQRKLDDLFND